LIRPAIVRRIFAGATRALSPDVDVFADNPCDGVLTAMKRAYCRNFDNAGPVAHNTFHSGRHRGPGSALGDPRPLARAFTSHYDSMSDRENEPPMPALDADAAKDVIRSIVDGGDIAFTGHALEELAKDNLRTTDCMNVLRGGQVVGTEVRHGRIRYRVETRKMTAIVTVVSEAELCVVTAWRNQT
jgi:hypothetical protein